MWSLIDKEMTLKECSVYCYAPEEDPYDGEEGAIWSLSYFFFNKARKRVAYLYVRGIPVMSHSPRSTLVKRSASGFSRENGAKKRARYWLGDRADAITNSRDLDDESDLNLWNPDDDDASFDATFEGDYGDDYNEADDESDEQEYKGPIRGVSEDIASRMEIE
jgi:Maf1 regulator